MIANNRYLEGSEPTLSALQSMHLQWFAEGDGTSTGTGDKPASEGTGNNGGSGSDRGQGEGPKLGWRAALKADLRDHELVKDKKDINEVTLALIQAHEKLKRSVALPSEKADEKELGEFYQKLGRPETKDHYTFEEPKLPQGLSYDKEFETWFREVAYRSGLTAPQAQALHKAYMDRLIQSYTEARRTEEQRVEEAKKALQSEWGSKFAERLQRADRYVTKLFGEEFSSWLKETGAANDLRVIKAMDKIAQLVDEDTIEKGRSSATRSKTDGGFFYNTPNMRE